jgi:hypothetical protein
MTQPELIALVELLNRAPMTQGERMWVQGLIARWEKGIAQPPPEPQFVAAQNGVVAPTE